MKSVMTAVVCISVFSGDAARALPPGPPSVFGNVYQSADAAWIRKEDKGTFMYLAVGLNHTNLVNQRARTLLFFDRSKCAVAKTKDLKVTVCSGSARGKKVSPDKFVFDPLMSEATLRHRGNKVNWHAEDPPEPWAYPIADPSFGAIGFASVDRWATASGKVLGKRFKKTKWSDWGFLSQGGYGGVLLNAPSARVWLDDADRLHYRFRFEQAS